MPRHHKLVFTLADGRQIGWAMKKRGDYWRVQFAHPTEDKRVEVSSGISVREPRVNVHLAAAKIINKYYQPQARIDPRKATWEAVMEDLEQHAHLRPRAWEIYVSILNVFRTTIPASKGPFDVTVEIAKTFRKLYAETPFKRSKAKDAKGYKRSAKTVENAVRRLSSLWEKLTPKYTRDNVWEHIDRPIVPKVKPHVPDEDEVQAFFAYLDARYPTWKLPRLFVEVKALAGCRLFDLSQIKSDQLDAKNNTLHIRHDQDKTSRERTIPLPPDLTKELDAIKGETYLWESCLPDSKKYRPSKKIKNRTTFEPKFVYHVMQNIFAEYRDQGGKLRSHGLRKRAITLMTLATQNIDQTAQAIGIDPQTARRYYLDAKQAFDGTELLKKMAEVLRPSTAPLHGEEKTSE